MGADRLPASRDLSAGIGISTVPDAKSHGLHPRAYLTLAILALFTIFSYVDRLVIVLLVDPIKADLGINDFQMSLLLGLAFGLCYGAACYPLGWLADRYSRRLVIFGGIVTWSLATAGAGLSTSFGELFAARFFVGIGEAALLPAAFSMMPDLFPVQRRAFATGILMTGAPIGAAIAFTAGGPIIAWAESIGGVSLPIVGLLHPWQLLFLIVGLPGFPVAFLIFLAPEIKAGRGRREETHDEGMRKWLGEHWLFAVGIITGTSFLSMLTNAIPSWTATYLMRVLHLDVALVGVSLGPAQLLGGLIGAVGGGMMIDRLNARRIRNVAYRYLIGIGAVLMFLVPFVFLFVHSFAFMLGAIVVIYIVHSWMVPLAAHLQLASPYHLRTRIIALVTTLTMIVGLIAGPSSVAFLTDYVFKDPQRLGWSIATVFLVCCPAAVLFYALSYRASERALTATSSPE